MDLNIKHYSSIDEFYQATADFCLERAQQAVASYGQFALVLAGGSTPMPLYRKLAEESRFPWNKTHLFWGDERCVLPDSELNNYHNTINALGGAGFIPNENIHRIKSELTPTAAAADYKREIADFRKKRSDGLCFDLVLLGMGNDGHTASLFPGSPALAEQDALVAAVPAPSTSAPYIPRITMTYPAFEAAATIAVMITGSEKRLLLKQLNEATEIAKKLPVSKIKAQKELIWFVA
jgi:6-phosphogluconolactonase